MRNRTTRHTITLCAGLAVAVMSAVPLVEAGSSLTSRSFRTFSTGPVFTNPGARYSLDYGTQFHTNPGGKYVYRGQNRKFHTNPGMKYVYPGHTTAPH